MQRWLLAASLLCATPVWAGELESLKAQVAVDDDAKADAAAKQLAESKDPKAIDVVLDTLAVGASPHVQATLLGALAGRKDPRALKVLEHYAKNRNPELRKKALQVLAELPGPTAVPTLIAGLSDSAPEVRAQAAAELGRRKERSAEPQLIKLLERKDESATRALAMLATPDLAHRIGEMLGQIPDALFCATLGEMLKRADFGPDPIRVEVVKTLGKVPGMDSTSALVEYVAATEKDKARPSRVEAQKIVDQRSSQ